MKHLRNVVTASCLALLLSLSAAPAAGIVQAESQHEQIHPRHHHGPFRGGHIIKDTEELTGIDSKTIVDQMKQGKTLQQIVQAKKGWSEDEYVKKLTETVSRNIDKALSEGKMDPMKADKIKSELPLKLKKIVNRPWKSPPGHPATEYQNNKINWAEHYH